VFNKDLYNQTVIPDLDPVSPVYINNWRFRLRVQKMSVSSTGWQPFCTASLYLCQK